MLFVYSNFKGDRLRDSSDRAYLTKKIDLAKIKLS